VDGHLRPVGLQYPAAARRIIPRLRPIRPGPETERFPARCHQQARAVVVPRRPARAGIDPLNKLIQREAGDNVVEVQ
jgi:hypothetical protein